MEQLSFDNGYIVVKFIDDNSLIIKIDVPCAVAKLDRNQAHLLKLWLEEHLKIDDKELEKANELVYQAWKDKIKLW